MQTTIMVVAVMLIAGVAIGAIAGRWWAVAVPLLLACVYFGVLASGVVGSIDDDQSDSDLWLWVAGVTVVPATIGAALAVAVRRNAAGGGHDRGSPRR